MFVIIKVALLDTGIDEWLVNGSNEVNLPNIVKGNYTQHGTNCYLILKKYIKNKKVPIKSRCILTNKGSGLIKNLKSALNWCVENNIKIVNLSCGTTNFKDYENLRNLINEYYYKGIIFIVASSNTGLMSYPSSLSTVIGVKTLKEQNLDYCINKNIHTGVDILALSTHKIKIFDISFYTPKSNSYATPYITAKVVDILTMNKYLTINGIKNKLLNKKYFQYFKPDWISKGYIIGNIRKTKAQFYFKTTKNIEEADTLIFYNKQEILEKYYNKNCVYLCNNYIEWSFQYFFWQTKNIEKYIEKSFNTKNKIEVPIIEINFDIQEDLIFFLCQIKKLFENNGYNAYVVSNETDSVLYDLNFIPHKYFNNNNYKNKIKNFLYWEVYYKQIDIIILCCNRKNINIESDLQLNLFNTHKLNLQILFNNDIVNNFYNSLDENSIKSIYYNIINLIGDTNE